MDISTIKSEFYREERFRTPLKIENDIGLWIDRTGSAVDSRKKSKLRILGQYATVYIESGSGELLTYSAGKKDLKPQDVILLFPEEPASYYPFNRWKTKWIVWNGPDAHNMEKSGFLNTNEPVIHDSKGIMLEAFNSIQDIMDREDIASVLERKIIVLKMVLKLFKLKQTGSLPDTPAYKTQKVVEYLNTHYKKHIIMEELSRQFNLSPTHFRRIFKKHTGKSPKEFLTSTRITRAKELISSGYAVKKVSGLVGYEDIFYFMRIFKKYTGVPPGRFKNLL